MTEPLFQGPKLKIERAERHIRDLQAAIDAFLGRDPYPRVIEDDAERGTRTVRMEVREVVPPNLGLIAGMRFTISGRRSTSCCATSRPCTVTPAGKSVSRSGRTRTN